MIQRCGAQVGGEQERLMPEVKGQMFQEQPNAVGKGGKDGKKSKDSTGKDGEAQGRVLCTGSMGSIEGVQGEGKGRLTYYVIERAADGLTGLSDVLTAPEGLMEDAFRSFLEAPCPVTEEFAAGECPICEWRSQARSGVVGRLWGARAHFWIEHRGAARALRLGWARTRPH